MTVKGTAMGFQFNPVDHVFVILEFGGSPLDGTMLFLPRYFSPFL